MSNATDFIEKLKEDTFREAILPHLLVIKEGDWDAVVKLAAAHGYTFTKAELIAAIPEGFYKGQGQHTDWGWDKSFKET